MTARALIVSVPNTSVGGFGKLPGARTDAKRMTSLLEDRGFIAVRVFGEGISVEDFKESLFDLRQDTKANDLCLIYVSGHGAQGAEGGGDEPHDSFLVLQNGVLSDDWFGDTFWPGVEPGSSWVTCADTCHSATILDRKVADAGERRRSDRAPRQARARGLLLPRASGSRQPAARAMVTAEVPDSGAYAPRIIFAAAADQENAKEVVVAGESVSWYTNQLINALTLDPHMTYRRLWRHLFQQWDAERNAVPGLGQPQVALTQAASNLAQRPAFASLDFGAQL